MFKIKKKNDNEEIIINDAPTTEKNTVEEKEEKIENVKLENVNNK